MLRHPDLLVPLGLYSLPNELLFHLSELSLQLSLIPLFLLLLPYPFFLLDLLLLLHLRNQVVLPLFLVPFPCLDLGIILTEDVCTSFILDYWPATSISNILLLLLLMLLLLVSLLILNANPLFALTILTLYNLCPQCNHIALLPAFNLGRLFLSNRRRIVYTYAFIVPLFL